VRRLLVAVALASPLGLLTGCAGFDHIEFSVSSSPVNVTVTNNEIRIPEGVAVVVKARPMTTDDVMSSDTEVKLLAGNPVFLGVSFAFPDSGSSESSEAQWSFVLSGVHVGTTTLSVQVDDEVEREIPAVIVAQ